MIHVFWATGRAPHRADTTLIHLLAARVDCRVTHMRIRIRFVRGDQVLVLRDKISSYKSSLDDPGGGIDRNHS